MLPCFTVSSLIPGVSVYIRSFKIRIGGRLEFSYNSGVLNLYQRKRILLSMHHARSF
jgi:hypothetical protein